MARLRYALGARPNHRLKYSRVDPDEDYDVWQIRSGKTFKSIRASQEHGPPRRTQYVSGPKILGHHWSNLSPTYMRIKRSQTRAEESLAWNRAAEAFDLLVRDFTCASAVDNVTPFIGYAGGNPVLTETLCKQLLDMIEEDGFKLVTREFSPPMRDCPLFDQTVWRGPHGVMLINAQSGRDVGDNITVAGHDVKLIARYVEWWEKHKVDESIVHAKISGIFSSATGMEMREFSSSIGWPLERGNYNKDVLAFYDLVGRELVSKTPSGRLAILDGKPGCGKTYLLRGLVEQLSDRAHFIYLPASMVQSLDGPQMLSLFEENRRSWREDGVSEPIHKILMVEDADECLVSRGPDNMSAIRNLLNFCDGFLGTMLDMRLIATTNSGYVGRTDKIDPALMRPGRLIGHITVNPLGVGELEQWFARHLPHDAPRVEINKPMTLAEAYAKARELGWKPKEV